MLYHSNVPGLIFMTVAEQCWVESWVEANWYDATITQLVRLSCWEGREPQISLTLI